MHQEPDEVRAVDTGLGETSGDSTRGGFLVLGQRPWSQEVFPVLRGLGGSWSFVTDPSDLSLDVVDSVRPEVVFVLHWSAKIEDAIIEKYECVGFHMTDLPFGRGGSPLQNLIIRGFGATMLSAFRLVSTMDAGPIYMKRPLRLDGTAHDIYRRMSSLQVEMIAEFLSERPAASDQIGEAVVFDRRHPEDSRIAEGIGTPRALFDFIRMLDAPEYPHAFLESAGLRVEFVNAKLEPDGSISATAQIRQTERERPT